MNYIQTATRGKLWMVKLDGIAQICPIKFLHTIHKNIHLCTKLYFYMSVVLVFDLVIHQTNIKHL